MTQQTNTDSNDWLSEIVGTFIALKFDVDVDDFSDGTLERWNNMKQAIQSKVDEMVREARVDENAKMSQRYFNHSERMFNADGEEVQGVACGQITHEHNKRKHQLSTNKKGGE